MPESVTLSQLESHLWEAANILRGPVGAVDFIAVNDYNLNTPRCIELKVASELLSAGEAKKRLQEGAEAACAAEDRLVGILKKEGILV